MNAKQFALILLLVVSGACPGTNLYVLANQAVVVQEDYRAICPISIDPNVVVDHILSAVPHDPNAWTVMYGAYDRPLLTHDPDGDPVTVTLESSKNGRGRIQTDANGIVHLRADLPPGEVFWAFVRVTDSPSAPMQPISKVFLIIFNVRDLNHAPILARIHYIQRQFMQACKVNGWNGRDRMGPAAQAWLAEWRG